MDIPAKRLKSGFEMPVYGIGTWRMGGDSHRTPTDDDAKDQPAIESAIEHGVTHIDTAEMYGAGYAEEVVGRAISRFDRSKLFVATKVLPSHAEPKALVGAAEASLRRLNTDYVDLYMMHSLPRDVPVADFIGAMNSLVNRGLVRNIGVSNFGPTNLENSIAISEHPIVVNQVHYNLAVREVESSRLLNFCQQNDVILAAWRPVRFQGLETAPIVDKLAEKYNKTPAQIAINWLISQDNVVTLARTRSEEHLEENLGALDWTMESTDIELLRDEYPNQEPLGDVPLDS
jgi:diketogulonate reductase-like aldo/keto reductase